MFVIKQGKDTALAGLILAEYTDLQGLKFRKWNADDDVSYSIDVEKRAEKPFFFI